MIPHSATLEINERVRALRRDGRDVLHLGFGEAGLPAHPRLVELLRENAADNRYAPVAGDEGARRAAAGYWTRRGLATDPDQILFAPGSKPLLFAALAALDGDVVLPVPSWVTYAAQAALLGRRVIGVPVPAGCGGVPDPDLLAGALDRARAEGADPRILVVTLPDNPTGTLAPPSVVEAVCAIADRQGLVVVSDEIYRDLVHDGSGVLSPASLLPDRTIVTAGLSKNLALGGWRVGFLRTPDSPEGHRRRDALRGIASEVWSNVAAPMQAAAEYALDEPEPILRRVAESRRLHGRVARAVASVFEASGALVRPPSAGFYLYPDFAPLRPAVTALGLATAADLGRHLLDRHGLALLPGDVFGDDPAALRFRVATSLLYGDTEQRLAALASPEPEALPWIAASLRRLDGVLATVREP
ncbi:aspartate aminotransferase [Actinocorallia herbida]|uniref:Aminotransferase n=1 Tax=Actinocorallia herbida TaxID=58109 RepID=A0A3N1CXL5_9ACTN|nr:pyridoxal phosphate-dependent aminotransferase [Actinocorallia herbida]ROO85458.1 aspartate aminotransferase [Actinocorallia herbida]